MSRLRHVVLVRHGETEGNSSVRFHGSADVALSDEGRDQMREAARSLRGDFVDLIVASPLHRAWESARILGGGAPVRLEEDFREIHFGRWEGMTAQEIEASDPVLYKQWLEERSRFEFPDGEPREDFRARVLRGLERLKESGAASALVVCHKGPVRFIAETLSGVTLEDGLPEVAGVVKLSQGADQRWHLGSRGSNPPDLAAA